MLGLDYSRYTKMKYINRQDGRTESKQDGTTLFMWEEE